MKDILNRLDGKQRQKLGEMVRFIIVGVAATAVQYGIYWLLLHWLNPLLANTIGYIVSFVFNYFASTMFTFKVKNSVRKGLGFVLSHLVNFSLQTGLLALFLHLGIEKQIALIPVYCICIPVNFLLVRFFLKR